jgi:hypothetical protein
MQAERNQPSGRRNSGLNYSIRSVGTRSSFTQSRRMSIFVAEAPEVGVIPNYDDLTRYIQRKYKKNRAKTHKVEDPTKMPKIFVALQQNLTQLMQVQDPEEEKSLLTMTKEKIIALKLESKLEESKSQKSIVNKSKWGIGQGRDSGGPMSIDSYRNKELWKVPPNMARREATGEVEPIPHEEQIKHQASKILGKMKERGYINSKGNTPDSVGQRVSESPEVFDQRFKHSTTAGDVFKLSKGQKALN